MLGHRVVLTFRPPRRPTRNRAPAWAGRAHVLTRGRCGAAIPSDVSCSASSLRRSTHRAFCSRGTGSGSGSSQGAVHLRVGTGARALGQARVSPKGQHADLGIRGRLSRNGAAGRGRPRTVLGISLPFGRALSGRIVVERPEGLWGPVARRGVPYTAQMWPSLRIVVAPAAHPPQVGACRRRIVLLARVFVRR